MKTRIVYAVAGVLFFLTPLSASLLAAGGMSVVGMIVGLVLLILGCLVLSINLRTRVKRLTVENPIYGSKGSPVTE